MNWYQMMQGWTCQNFFVGVLFLFLHIAATFFHSNEAIFNSNISALFLERNSNIIALHLMGCTASLFLSGEMHWKWIFISAACECKSLFFGISIMSIKIISMIVHYRTAPNQKPVNRSKLDNSRIFVNQTL